MKINQDIVDRTFMVRNGTCGSYYEQDDVDRIKEVLLQKFGVSVSNSEAIDFWIWRCNEWDGSWFGVDPQRDSDLIEEYFQKFIEHVGIESDDEDEPDHVVKVTGQITPFPDRVGVHVLVKDNEGCTWDVELDPDYHAQLVQEIEAQIPEKSEGGTIRCSLEYEPSKVWNARKVEQ